MRTKCDRCDSMNARVVELTRERDELRERLDIVNETNTLKQTTIHELQRQRDELCAKLADAKKIATKEIEVQREYASLNRQLEARVDRLRKALGKA